MSDQTKYTIKKDSKNIKDFLYSDKHKPLTNLPSSINLAPKCSPVVDQGDLGSCSSNSIVSGLREYLLINQEKKPLVRLSRLFVYWWERHIQGTVNIDSGASLRDGMKILCKYGVCTEKTDPYDITKFAEKPSDEEMREALQYRINGYQRLNTLDEIKDALYHGYISVFSMEIYESFKSEEVSRTGMVPLPKENQVKFGGHSMCLVGYDDNLDEGCFIVRNSWGTEWGQEGYCFIPYDMMQYFMDVWTVQYGKKYLSDYFYQFINFIGFVRKKISYFIKLKIKGN